MDHDDKILCYCLRRRQSEIITAWHKRHFSNLEEFMDETKVGTVCTSCRSTVRELLLKEAYSAMAASSEVRTLQKIYSKHELQLSFYQRVKKNLRRIKNSYTGMREINFYTFYRFDDGFKSAISIQNLANPDFPKMKVDLIAQLTCFGKNGEKIYQGEHLLPYGGTHMLYLEPLFKKGAAGHYGLLRIDVWPSSIHDARKWKIGSLRPYLSLEKNGLILTIHEKSLWFNTPRVAPGIEGSPWQEVRLALANIDAGPGLVSIKLKTKNHEEEKKLDFMPYSAHFFTIPEKVLDETVEQVELYSTMSLTGYQYVTSKRSGLTSVQHLVKEGN